MSLPGNFVVSLRVILVFCGVSGPGALGAPAPASGGREDTGPEGAREAPSGCGQVQE